MNYSLIEDFFNDLIKIFTKPLFNIAGGTITLAAILYFCITLFLLFYLSSLLRNFIANKVLPRYKIERGISQSIASIVRYIIVIIGLYLLVVSLGVNLTSLGIAAGALGVGIGFGLQNITNNFISGIIILFERPIKVGDRIEVGLIKGDVVKINPRATTIITNDNITVIVPNSDFINTTVINWSHNDRMVRFNFKVKVSYKEDPAFIKKILLEVAKENDGVLKNPSPDVLFNDYAESALDFILRVWTSQYIDRPNVLKSQLYYAIFEKFRQNNVEIPFPQRDLHIKTGLEQFPISGSAHEKGGRTNFIS
jgi:small-conductance mechanosensitive channel